MTIMTMSSMTGAPEGSDPITQGSIKAFASHGKACGQQSWALRKWYDWLVTAFFMQLMSTLHMKGGGAVTWIILRRAENLKI